MPQHLQKQVGYLFVTWIVSQYLGQMRSELQREEEERNLQKKLEREREIESDRERERQRDRERMIFFKPSIGIGVLIWMPPSRMMFLYLVFLVSLVIM
jgi:Mg2+/citrate symporter